MTKDEKLVEKVAEAMWNTTWAAEYGVSWGEAVAGQGAIIIDFRKYARAAIACVRENDKAQPGVMLPTEQPCVVCGDHGQVYACAACGRIMKGGIKGC